MMNAQRPIYIVGVGSFATQLLEKLRKFCVEVEGVVDEISDKKSFHGLPILSVKDGTLSGKLVQEALFFIAISQDNYRDDAFARLVQVGVPRHRLIYFPPSAIEDLFSTPFNAGEFLESIYVGLPGDLDSSGVFDNSYLIDKYLLNHHLWQVNKVFYPVSLFGRQGLPARHFYMSSAVASLNLDRPLKILEIGSWCGESMEVFARSLSAQGSCDHQLVCVDIWDHYIVETDMSADAEAGQVPRQMAKHVQEGLPLRFFLNNLRALQSEKVRINCIKGRAQEILPLLEKGSFDLVYVDGSHYYQNVLEDIRLSRELVREGGILCGDDLEVEIRGDLREFCEDNKNRDYLSHPQTGEGFHPGVTLAVADSFEEVANYHGFWAVTKTKERFEPLCLEGYRPIPPICRDEAYQKAYLGCAST